MKRVWIIALFASLLFVPALAVRSATEQPRRGGILQLGVQRDLIMMNPMVATRSSERAIRELMFEPLLSLDLKGKIQPNLAETWKVSEDGRVYTFQLRRAVKFHNGQEMTAEDVKFSIDYTMNPKNGAYGQQHLRLIDRVEIADRYTLKITMKKASPSFLAPLTDIQSFAIVPKGSLGEGIEKPSIFPPGTGPFKFVEWKPEQQIVFERFDDYWGHKAFLDRVILRPVHDDTIRFIALQAGDLDIVERVPHESVKQVKEAKLKNLRLAEAATASWRVLMLNVADPPFNDKRLRLAIAHAIDKKEMLLGAYFGFGAPIDQRYPRGHEWHVAGLSSPAFNLAKAAALVKEAGYTGKTIPILVEQSAVRETEAITLQAQLKKIGIEIKLDVIERGAFTNRLRQGNYAFVTYGGSHETDPSATYSDIACERDLKRRAVNLSGYCDKEMDGLLERLATELNPTKRKETYRQVLKKIAEDVLEIAIGFVPRYFAMRDYVKGFSTDDEGMFMWSGGGLNYTWLDK